MKSAFGVDHGEVEKAFNPAGLFRAAGGARRAAGPAKIGNPFTAAGGAIGGATRKLGGSMVRGGAKTKMFAPGMGGVGRAQVKAGGGLRRLGAGMMQRPGLTGGLAAGGAAAGIGGGAAAIGNRRKFQ